ncbi:MAG TPA: CcmD family protein [Bacteroidia bacterium]
MKKIFLFTFFLLNSVLAFSQEVEMADQLRSSGKIYVVVGVVLVILIGLLLFLFLIERKVGKIEKQINKK